MTHSSDSKNMLHFLVISISASVQHI